MFKLYATVPVILLILIVNWISFFFFFVCLFLICDVDLTF